MALGTRWAIFAMAESKLTPIRLTDNEGTVYKGKQHYLATTLNKLRQEGDFFCDVVLEAEGGRQFSAHRCVLAANSEFFHAMFRSGMKESAEGVSKFHALTASAMSSILEYFYTHEVIITAENVSELLDCASFFLVPPVRNACLMQLSEKLSVENCFASKRLAEMYNADDLLKKAKRCIVGNFFHLIKQEEHRQDCLLVSEDELLDVIGWDGNSTVTKEDKYFAVLDWVRHDLDKRGILVPGLLKSLDIKSLTKKFLKDQLKTEPLLRDNKSCNRLISGLINKRKKKEAREATIVEEKSSADGEVVICLDGIRTILYDVSRRKILSLPGRPYEALPFGKSQLAVIDYILYVVGGIQMNSLTLDGKADQLFWETMSPPYQPQIDATLAVLDRCIYLIGGRGVNQCVECYDPELNSWSFVKPMQVGRTNAGAAASKEHVFVIGGCDKDKVGLKSAEMYKPCTNTWTFVAPMSEPRVDPAVTYLGGKIYVIGGYHSCEVYSPHTDEWSFISTLPSSHLSYHSFVLRHRNIYALLSTSERPYRFVRKENSWVKSRALRRLHFPEFEQVTSLQLPEISLQKLWSCRSPWFFSDASDFSEDEELDFY